MTRFRNSSVLMLCCLCAAYVAALSVPANAQVKYFEDPVFESFNPDAPSPMAEMIALAEGGDARAMYILGDLYAKGKGGMVKSHKKAAAWFERSAAAGYPQGFIRLAALAKQRNMPITAWKWYALAGDIFPYGDWRRYALKARDAVEADFKMKSKDIDRARVGVNKWKARQKEARRAEEKAKRAAAREKPAAVKKEPDVKEKESHGEDQG